MILEKIRAIVHRHTIGLGALVSLHIHVHGFDVFLEDMIIIESLSTVLDRAGEFSQILVDFFVISEVVVAQIGFFTAIETTSKRSLATIVDFSDARHFLIVTA
jgi:hypothetical protein